MLTTLSQAGAGALAAVLLALPVEGRLTQQEFDSVSLHKKARSAQASFERRRARELPRVPGAGRPSECDEIVGRFCVWDVGEGDAPDPEPPAIVAHRLRLLEELRRLHRSIPGDAWILAQRVRYLVEAGQVSGAAALASVCGIDERWKCLAFLGYALHRLDETTEAEEVFSRALELMPAERRREWTGSAWAMEDELLRWIAAQSDTVLARRRAWLLADPLLSVPGNERWTAHLARWSHALVSRESRSPHQMRWGKDLTEMVVRFGWPIGWERPVRHGWDSRDFSLSGLDRSGSFYSFPRAELLEPLNGEQVQATSISIEHRKSAYMPAYLDALEELRGQAARFWRPYGVAVLVAGGPLQELRAHDLVASLWAERDGEVVLMQKHANWTALGVRLRGLVPFARDEGPDSRSRGVIGLEAWSASARRAKRMRVGAALGPVPQGALALSDIALLEPRASLPDSLGNLLPALRTDPAWVEGDGSLGIAFEVYGLRESPGEAEMSVWVESKELGFLRRLGERLRLIERTPMARISWSEGARGEARAVFRALRIDLPDLPPGLYEVGVEVEAHGWSPISRRRSFRVGAPPD